MLKIRITGDEDYAKHLKVLVCGDPGAGKTLMASTWPKPFWAATTDAGLVSLAHRQVPVAEVHSTTDFLHLRHILDQPPEQRAEALGVEVETLVVDTLDGIQRLLAAERRHNERKEVLTGPDYGWLGDEMRAIITGLRNLPLHVVLNCHIRQTEDQATGRTYVMPALIGAMSGEIASYVDLSVLLRGTTTIETTDEGVVHRKIVRYAQTYPDQQHTWVKDHSGQLPAEFPVNFKDDYQRLSSFFSQKLPPSRVVKEVGEVEADRARAVKEEIRVERPAEEEEVAPPPVVPQPVPAPVPEEPIPAPAPPPEPEPPVAQPEPEPEPEPEPKSVFEPESEPEPDPEPEPQPEAVVQDDEMHKCEVCSDPYDEAQHELSYLRYKQSLCRKCFIAKKNTR